MRTQSALRVFAGELPKANETFLAEFVLSLWYNCCMSSPSQIEANRLNARQSNGAQTAEGKAASSKNALKHGLLSKDILLPNEDAEA
jgi:hypothetical protein